MKKVMDYSIMVLIYLSYEIVLYKAETCGTCDIIGYLITGGYVVINYFVIQTIFLYRNREHKIVVNNKWRIYFLTNAVAFVSLYLMVDYFRRKFMH